MNEPSEFIIKHRDDLCLSRARSEARTRMSDHPNDPFDELMRRALPRRPTGSSRPTRCPRSTPARRPSASRSGAPGHPPSARPWSAPPRRSAPSRPRQQREPQATAVSPLARQRPTSATGRSSSTTPSARTTRAPVPTVVPETSMPPEHRRYARAGGEGHRRPDGPARRQILESRPRGRLRRRRRRATRSVPHLGEGDRPAGGRGGPDDGTLKQAGDPDDYSVWRDAEIGDAARPGPTAW